MRYRLGVIAFAALMGTVLLANWLITRFGIVPVGFGLSAPAGVYAVAVAFVCRDIVQNLLGRWAAVGAILCGAALSLFVSESFAIASALAFAASETVDFTLYTALRGRGWLPAALPAGLCAAVVDSLLFLWLAFGSETFLSGQIVGKAWGVLAGVLIATPWRRTYVVSPRTA